ncbi:MAG: aldo/keto reductase [Acidobacteriaceae bacterium]|nr:aldo/keto reductase [Acidobacteriaceae bacterium]
MDYCTLGNTGLQVSKIGFGASPLGNEFGPLEMREAACAVRTALDAGINLFDVSPYYGRTLAEERLGVALEGRRDQAILATKCGRYDKRAFDFSPRRVRSSVEESLARLRTDRLDLLAAHDIEFTQCDQIINETIPAMRELQREGKVRFLGISGLPLRMLADVAQRAAVDYVLSYCHYNLLIQDLDRWLTPTLETKGIGLINASPLHMRLLTDQGPPEWNPAPEKVRRAGAEIVALCRRYGADPAIVALRFCLDHPYVSSTLVGMSGALEVENNLKALNTPIDPDLLEKISQIAAPVSEVTWASGLAENSDV